MLHVHTNGRLEIGRVGRITNYWRKNGRELRSALVLAATWQANRYTNCNIAIKVGKFNGSRNNFIN